MGRKPQYDSLWITNPEYASLLKYKDRGYQITKGSVNKEDWICPECGFEILQKSICNVVSHGLSCPICSNTRSLGHRMINGILSILEIPYICEKQFLWSNGKSYDTYIEKYNCIIEVHGAQHYEECGLNKLGNNSLKNQQDNDLYKMKLALDNGIKNYIVINARISDFNFIKTNIINSKLSKLFDLNNVDDTELLKLISKSDFMEVADLYNQGCSVKEICQKLHYSRIVIERKLHQLTKLGICQYKGLKEKEKSVICLNTGEIFEKLQDAGIKYNINPNGISFCCKGLRNRKTAGKLSDGTKLKWLFKEDYDTLSKDEIEEILNTKHKKSVGSHKVVCLNTGEIFNMIKDAQKKYPNASGITDCCRGIGKSSGINPIDGNPLKWVYYEDYINMSKNDIDNIINDINYNDKRVVCCNNKMVFENMTIAGKWCGVRHSGISSCINNNYNYNGIHPDTGEKLTWMKYLDYIEKYGESGLIYYQAA